jgi:hypothetical protein
MVTMMVWLQRLGGFLLTGTDTAIYRRCLVDANQRREIPGDAGRAAGAVP